MGKLNDIRQKLSAGSKTSQLIEQGYAKSSVLYVAKKLKDIQPNMLSSPVPDEIQELRHHKEIMKLKKDIAELEAAKENLPERVAALEKTVLELRSLINDAVDTALWRSLVYAGMDREEAKEYASGWVDRNIKS